MVAQADEPDRGSRAGAGHGGDHTETPSSSARGLGECDATADELCRPPSSGAQLDRATADEWLLAALAGGPRPAKELQEEARAAGYCARTLERAKRRLGVVARRVRKDGRALWQWSDPALPHGAGRRR